MRRFHSNAGSFGQPRRDSQSPHVLQRTVLFVFLEAFKLSPKPPPLPPFQRRPDGPCLTIWLSNPYKHSEHPLPSPAYLKEVGFLSLSGREERQSFARHHTGKQLAMSDTVGPRPTELWGQVLST